MAWMEPGPATARLCKGTDRQRPAVLAPQPDSRASPAVSLSESPCSKCTRVGRAVGLGVQGHVCEQSRGC